MITIRPIGIVHVNLPDEDIKNSLNGVEGVIEIFPQYREGLIGLEGFSHLIIIAYLHKVDEKERGVLKVRFRRLQRFGIDISTLPEVGVFCTDSPHRPNPIAITIVRLLKIIDRFIYVDELDLFDKTPVLDIKAYTPNRIVKNISVPEWYKNIHSLIEEIKKNK